MMKKFKFKDYKYFIEETQLEKKKKTFKKIILM